MKSILFVLALAILPLSCGQILESECHVSGTGYHETSISGASFEEAVYFYGVVLNYNITQDGLLTCQNGTAWQLVDENGCLEWVPL